MPYTAEISRANPTAIVFLVDQSGSMNDPFGADPSRTKSRELADAINRLLHNLQIQSTKDDGIRDYFQIGVIGYGAQVKPAFGGTALSGRELVRISELANNPLRIEERTRQVPDGSGGLVPTTVKFPVWFDPVAENGTPMKEAIDCAYKIVSRFVQQAPRAFPPIVLNLTDAEVFAAPESEASAVRALSTEDGNVLLFNLHISSKNASPILFAGDEAGLPDELAKALFRMSSPLPSSLQEAARKEGHRVTDASRGFVFNADPVAMIQFLRVGTRIDQNMR